VEDCWTSIGSTNFDNRSFRLNDEANLNVYDADFDANRLRRSSTIRNARVASLSQSGRIILGPKLKDRAAGLLRSQL
jgi:cardiolipin synthase A/B